MTSDRIRTGQLQIMNGTHIGRIIRLDEPVTRIGAAGGQLAMVANQPQGYLLSHLEGPVITCLNGNSLDDSPQVLNDGDTIDVGELRLQFVWETGIETATGEDIEQQRRFSRVAFDAPVRLLSPDGSFAGQIIDLSLKGALVTRPADWQGQGGDELKLEVQLNPDIVLHMDMRVVHAETDRLGLQCEGIDVDSITHLRRLIELNLADASLLERELSSLG